VQLDAEDAVGVQRQPEDETPADGNAVEQRIGRQAAGEPDRR
jgi:hypothetical protein